MYTEFDTAYGLFEGMFAIVFIPGAEFFYCHDNK